MSTGDMLLGVTLRWTSIPSRGEQQYSQLPHATETGIVSGPAGFLGSCATLPISCLRPNCFPGLIGGIKNSQLDMKILTMSDQLE